MTITASATTIGELRERYDDLIGDEDEDGRPGYPSAVPLRQLVADLGVDEAEIRSLERGMRLPDSAHLSVDGR